MAVNWTKLESEKQLSDLREKSQQQTILIFKHSTRCSISRAALDRLERNWDADKVGDVQTYYLDLLENRSLSNRIAEDFDVQHESPQVLLIRNGQSFYDRSHFDIDFISIRQAVKEE